MDKITMKDMVFFGYHGVLTEENKLGQRFIVSVELLTDLKKAGNTDSVTDTVNYAEVYAMVKAIVEKKCFKLLEALAENIAQSIIEGYENVLEVIVNIKKPNAPISGIFEYFGVEIRRKRNE
ncbi:MAG: dihydroneopterin aldolase [Bacillota bacterium]